MTNLTIKNNDESSPVIVRLIRTVEDQELDCVSETQLLPQQVADFEVGQGQALTVITR